LGGRWEDVQGHEAAVKEKGKLRGGELTNKVHLPWLGRL